MKKNNLQGLLKMNLQLLSEDTGANNGGETTPPEETKPEGKTYTDEELQKLIQSESDKRVTQAIKTKEKEWEETYKKRLEDEKSEAEKLAKMSADERAKAELEKREQELKAREDEIDRRELQAQAKAELTEKGYPVELAGVLIYETADSVKESIERMGKLWESAVQKGISDRLKGDEPLPGKKENKVDSVFETHLAKYR